MLNRLCLFRVHTRHLLSYQHSGIAVRFDSTDIFHRNTTTATATAAPTIINQYIHTTTLLYKMTDKSNKPKDKKKTTADKPLIDTRQLFHELNESVPTDQCKCFDSTCIQDSYQPQEVEYGWDKYWESNKLYQPNNASTAPIFSIVIPPPNVTGILHIGHALTLAIEDSLVRYKRMCGYNTLWVPGSDAAGIATQVVVEKKLSREQNMTRHELGRDKFIDQVWNWKHTNGNVIYNQIRRLGASVDWQHEAFTMNDKLNLATTEAFVQLYNKGIIYRSNRLVNWSCTLRTAISSIEVEYIDLESSTMLNVPGYTHPIEFGVIHSFAYTVVDSDEQIIVATTRIETMLGDSAVAVHPDDTRYKHLHGKKLRHPFVSRNIPIICDSELVDMSFGTGAVKITPAHDPNDFQCGKRHGLDEINILTDDGLINSNGGTLFDGMKRFDCRSKIIDELSQLGLYRGKTNNKMNIGICSRSKDIVEPVIRPQWWVSMTNLAKRGIESLQSGELRFIPSTHDKTWYNWLDNIQDWCISRQLWWGNRIPAYFIKLHQLSDGEIIDKGNEKYWVVARSIHDATVLACKKFNCTEDEFTITQDEDVLDTWFGAGLFPFSTLGWPNTDSSNIDYNKYFPTTLLETGHDILFFWVARMVMLSLELNNKLPFNTVYLHAMVRDKLGRKMSKSLGNVIDPLDVIYGATLDELHNKLKFGNLPAAELKVATQGQIQQFPNGISECGSDALRFGLLAYTAQGRDINLDINRVVAYRQFGNKLWQVCKFALKYFSDNPQFIPVPLDELHTRLQYSQTRADQYILHQLYTTTDTINQKWNSYEFSDVTTQLYNFWLYELCDIYIECIKPIMYGDNQHAIQCSLNILHTCLITGLKLMHPVMPFITEELYHRMPHTTHNPVDTFKDTAVNSIMIQQYPQAEQYKQFHQPDIITEFDLLKSIVKSCRQIRSELQLTKQRIDIYVQCNEQLLYDMVTQNTNVIQSLGSTNNVYVLHHNQSQPSNCLSIVVSSDISLHAPLDGLNDVGLLLIKMEKDNQLLQSRINNLQLQMSQPTYATKMRDDIKQQNNDKLNADTIELHASNQFISRLYNAMSPAQRDTYRQAKIDDKMKLIEFNKTKVQSLSNGLDSDRSKWPPKTRGKIEDVEKEVGKLQAELQQIQLDNHH